MQHRDVAGGGETLTAIESQAFASPATAVCKIMNAENAILLKHNKNPFPIGKG